MVRTMDRIRRPMTDPRSAEPADAELMLAVARHRDVSAFEQLFSRHERSAFNLAKHLTGNSSLAEDAIQDAALRLWTLADKFRPDGNFKGWFLKIVANCSKRHQSERKRDKTRAEQLVRLPPASVSMEELKSVEFRELTEAVQNAMGHLEPTERRLVALYYGASLDQRAIGELLDLPQTTVSMRIRQAIGKLRASLTTAGFAASLPLLETGQLSEVVIGNEPVPQGLRAKIMSGLSAAARNSTRVTAVSWTKVAITVLAAIGILAGAVVGYCAWSSDPQPPVSQAVVGANGSSFASPKYLRNWDFNTSDQVDELFSLGHAMSWLPKGGPDGSGCMKSPPAITEAVLKIPSDFRLPIKVRWKERFEEFAPGYDRGLLMFGWSGRSIVSFGIFRNSGALLTTTRNHVPWRNGELYLSEHFMDLWLDGERTSVSYVDLNPERDLTLIARGSYRVDDMTIEEIRPDELPDDSAFRSAIEGIDPADRSGIHVQPQIKSPRLGELVILEFGETGRSKNSLKMPEK